MLLFKQRQLAALEQAQLRSFEDRTLAHLRQWFPGHWRLLGEAPMRQAIREGVELAQRDRMGSECCTRTYIEFMCLLGSGFATDPMHPWAGQILFDPGIQLEVERGDRLYERAWAHIRQLVPDYRDAAGQPTTQRFVAALRQLDQMDDAVPHGDTAPAQQHRVARRLAGLFPAKTACVGEDALLARVALAQQLAAQHGLEGERGTTLLSALGFVLGHRFDRDPLLPWISANLADQALLTPRQKVDALLRDGVAELRRWWSVPH